MIDDTPQSLLLCKTIIIITFHCSNFLCLIFRLRSRVAEEENFRSEDNLHEILSLAVKTTADADLNARNVSGFYVYLSSQSTHVSYNYAPHRHHTSHHYSH